jgi:Xaa-Pro aminopeptidase
VIWPPASGIAIHRESGRTIHFETEIDEVLTRLTTISPDIRIHRDSRTRKMGFITAELSTAGWVSDTVGLGMFSHRPNRGHSERFEAALAAAGATVVDATHILHDVRRIKSPQER